MLRLLAYLFQKGVVTTKAIPHMLDPGLTGLPRVTEASCDSNCRLCIETCPTAAISTAGQSVAVDRGACIGCNQCVEMCPTGTLENDLSVKTFAYNRDELVISSGQAKSKSCTSSRGPYNASMAIRVVSTGCSACDLELSAASNSIFDMDRLGINIVASPRFADALLITGPVPKAMHEPLLSCYKSMASPKIVIACGTCAISGGMHSRGYAEANGVGAILPVDVYIPGCPPHPWQIIEGIKAARSLAKKR